MLDRQVCVPSMVRKATALCALGPQQKADTEAVRKPSARYIGARSTVYTYQIPKIQKTKLWTEPKIQKSKLWTEPKIQKSKLWNLDPLSSGGNVWKISKLCVFGFLVFLDFWIIGTLDYWFFGFLDPDHQVAFGLIELFQ